MTQKHVTTKADLLDAIDETWPALNAALYRLSESQLTSIRDDQGWSVKDHLIHLAAWERSVVFFLQGKPRADGLGVSQAVYEQGDDDAINAVIHRQRHALPLAEAVSQLRAVHAELMALLRPLSDDDLLRSYRHFLPDEPGDGDGPPAIDVVFGNTASHFNEHLQWIGALLGR